MNSTSENILPKGWRMMRLKDKEVCELIMGQSPSSETYNLEGKGLPFFQGKKEFGKVHPVAEKYCSKPSKIASPGDILMSVRAPVGPTNIADVECCIGRGLAAIRHNPRYTLKNYLLYYFKNFESEFAKKGKGSTFSAITKGALEESTIFIPPLEEQKHLVTKIDTLFAKIDKAISLTEESLKQARNLLPSVLNEVFEKGKADGWEEKKLGEVFKLTSGKFLPKRKLINGKHKVYGGNGITALHNDYFIENETIVIGRVGEYCGATHIVDKKSWVTDNGLYCKEFFLDVNLGFLKSILTNMNLNQYAKTSGQPSISQTTVHNLSVPMPLIKRQKEIENYFASMNKLNEQSKSKLEEQLSYLRQLKSSILSKAFKGEL